MSLPTGAPSVAFLSVDAPPLLSVEPPLLSAGAEGSVAPGSAGFSGSAAPGSEGSAVPGSTSEPPFTSPEDVLFEFAGYFSAMSRFVWQILFVMFVPVRTMATTQRSAVTAEITLLTISGFLGCLLAFFSAFAAFLAAFFSCLSALLIINSFRLKAF